MKVIKSLDSEDVDVRAMGAEPWMQFIASIDPFEENILAVNAKQLVDNGLSIGIKGGAIVWVMRPTNRLTQHG